MQGQSTSLAWLNAVYSLLVAFIAGGGIVKLLESYRNRRKVPAEIEKTQAETRRIHVHSDTEISNSVIRVTSRLEAMQERVDEIIKERDELRLLADKQKMELEFNELQIRKMKAVLDIHGIKLSDFDPPSG